MAELSPPLYMEGGTYHALNDRELLKHMFPVAGTLTPGAMAVTAHSPNNMSVDVAAGRAIVLGTTAAEMGSYLCNNNTTTVLTITASNPTNPRIDLVIAEVRDGFYTGVGTENLWRLRVVAGTPAGSPTAPAVPADSLALAEVLVPANASSIVPGNITNRRVFGGMKPWAMPWGIISTGTLTTTGFTTVTDIAGSTLPSFTAIANRQYRVTVNVLTGASGACRVQYIATDSANTQLGSGQWVDDIDVVTSNIAGTFFTLFTASGSLVAKVRGTRLSGAGASTANSGTILLEDIGPVPGTI